jgi:hypothetical protein
VKYVSILQKRTKKENGSVIKNLPMKETPGKGILKSLSSKQRKKIIPFLHKSF